jgi:hypothetical protein
MRGAIGQMPVDQIAQVRPTRFALDSPNRTLFYGALILDRPEQPLSQRSITLPTACPGP